MDFKERLYHLRRLFNDSERKLQDFNEIIPFQFNPEKIYSPKLVNLILEVGPQIEDIAKLIISELALSEKRGVTSRIKEINKNGVLSSFEIFCFLHNKLLSDPFEQKREWWDIYNKTKHDLSKSQFDIKYNSVVDALGSLAALHRFASVLVKIRESLDKKSEEEYKKYVLKKENWTKKLDYNAFDESWIQGGNTALISDTNIWRSKLFEISTYFTYEVNLVPKIWKENDLSGS